jgi:hypothetical protein
LEKNSTNSLNSLFILHVYGVFAWSREIDKQHCPTNS